jgi:putative ABC transport system ATP-binding protein
VPVGERLRVSTKPVEQASDPLIRLTKVTKSYRRGKQEVPVLTETDLEIRRGSFEAIMGPSGSGKTTLLNLISGIDRASSGQIVVSGTDITHLSEDEMASWRLRNIGFIFQFYNLVQVLTAFQNVELPLLLSGLNARERRERVATVLSLVGLEDRHDYYPNQLSGGQEQRVSIARAIVTDPELLVADEPTGDLDRESSKRIVELLVHLNRTFNKTIVLVTHDPEVALHAQVLRRIDKGQLLPPVLSNAESESGERGSLRAETAQAEMRSAQT